MSVIEVLQKLHKGVYTQNYTCYICRNEVFDGRAFCAECRKNLPFNTRFCQRCGRKIIQSGYCLDCKAKMPDFTRARSAFTYDDEIINLVHALKAEAPQLASGFARELLPILKREFFDADFITFVPMSDTALQKRGYNQSKLLAENLSALSNVPVEDVFQKVKDTNEQKRLSHAERNRNLQGAFHLHKRAVCKDKRILIVDDTFTTGATTETLARLLLGAGASDVYVLTVASVVWGHNPKDSESVF